MTEREKELFERLAELRKNIEAACRKGGRAPEELRLCAVSKRMPLSDIEAVMEKGQLLFGENYVQELLAKQDALSEKNTAVLPEWHMIGHLQRNKVRQVLGRVSLIHSVDSLSLAAQIEKEAAARNLRTDLLLEVNVAEEPNKWGFSCSELLSSAQKVSRFSMLRIRGLMTSAPYTEDPESNRPYFRRLHALFQELKEQLPEPSGFDTLSMGMSGDYTVAIEEGATLIRVGTSLFGSRS